MAIFETVHLPGMKRVYVAQTPVDAQFVKAFLESAGIPASVRGEHLFTLRGLVPVTEDTLPAVWVSEDEDLERATELLGQLEARARLRPVDGEDEDAAAPDEAWDEAGEKLG
jgi:hypothetical protein